MTQMNSHGYGLHPTVSIKIFHFALKSYFNSKPVRSFRRTLYLVSNNNHEATQCALFFSFLLLLPSQAKYPPQHLVSSIFSLRSSLNVRKKSGYNTVSYFNLYIFRQQREAKDYGQKAAGIP